MSVGRLFILILGLICCLTACKPKALPNKTFLVMGTFFTVTLPADKTDYMEPVGVLSANALYGLEQQLSIFRPESEISRLNRTAGGEPVELSPTTIGILEAARYYYEISDGVFDITIPPLMDAWKLYAGEKPSKPPGRLELEEALALTGYNHVKTSGNNALLELPGMRLDLGGIAKGYAVDEVGRIMTAHGVRDILINLGGNILALGQAASDRPWRIAVQNPFASGNLLGTLALHNGEAVATSGNYERFVMIDGQRYAHIIDPRDGLPVSGIAGVTIMTSGENAAMTADALSTTLFVIGTDQGVDFLQAHFPQAAAMFIPDRRPLEIYITQSFAARFTPASVYADAVKVITPSTVIDRQ